MKGSPLDVRQYTAALQRVLVLSFECIPRKLNVLHKYSFDQLKLGYPPHQQLNRLRFSDWDIVSRLFRTSLMIGTNRGDGWEASWSTQIKIKSYTGRGRRTIGSKFSGMTNGSYFTKQCSRSCSCTMGMKEESRRLPRLAGRLVNFTCNLGFPTSARLVSHFTKSPTMSGVTDWCHVNVKCSRWLHSSAAQWPSSFGSKNSGISDKRRMASHTPGRAVQRAEVTKARRIDGKVLGL
ncbi:hypothetical protein J3A83DRAFT_1866620 [Scleroderma citrinum]